MIRARRWILLALSLAAVAGCGKPKPREVAELQLDGKVIELKPAEMSALRSQFEQLCEVAGFVQTQVDVQSQTVSVAGSPSKGTTGGGLTRSLESSEERHGDRTLSTQRMTLKLGNDVEGMLTEYKRLAPNSSIDPKVHARILDRLEALRKGWQLAVLYHSDTAPESSVTSYDTYFFQKVTLGPASVQCLVQSAQGKDARR